MKPVVLLQGPITGKMLEGVWDEIIFYKERNEKDITLVINSEGGHGTKTLEFIGKMINSGLEFSAKIYHAESGSALVALAANRREMTKNGRFIIHLGSVEVESGDIAEDGTIPTGFRTAAANIREMTFDLMVHAGIPRQGPHLDILLARNRLKLTADECFKLKIVEQIIG